MVTMSQKEFQRVKVIENAVGGRLSVSEAAALLQLSERQVQRLKRRYRPDGVAWVQHGNRGRPIPWALQHGRKATHPHPLQLHWTYKTSVRCQCVRTEPERPTQPRPAAADENRFVILTAHSSILQSFRTKQAIAES
jgi:hypothetical protein